MCLKQHKHMSQSSQAVKKEANRQLHIRYLFILCVSNFFKYIYISTDILQYQNFKSTNISISVCLESPALVEILLHTLSLLSKLCDLEINEVKYFANGQQK